MKFAGNMLQNICTVYTLHSTVISVNQQQKQGRFRVTFEKLHAKNVLNCKWHRMAGFQLCSNLYLEFCHSTYFKFLFSILT